MFSLVILVQVCCQQFSQPLFIWIYLFLTFISEYFHLSNSRIEIFILFYHYKDFIPFTPNLHCFWWEINSRSPHFSSVCNAFFSRVRVNERFTAVVATLCEAYSGGRELLGSSSESSEVLSSWGSRMRLSQHACSSHSGDWPLLCTTASPGLKQVS